MRLETFFEKFGLFADAPGAVAKMRELVLDLAVSGRLIPPKTKWPKRSLKSLATKIGSGATPAGGRESYFSEGIPLIRSMNVHFRGFDRAGLVFLSDEQASQLSNVVVQPLDVLLNITGASIGRVTTAPSEMAGARVNQHVTIIRPIPDLLPMFLTIFLASPSVQLMIDEIQVGATRQALTKGMIEQFEIPLPSLAEQKRIVAKMDELMALCDRLEAQQQERDNRHAALARASLTRFAEAPTPANLDFLFHQSYPINPADLRKAILSLAVQGKLVPQDRNDKPAAELIKRRAPKESDSGDQLRATGNSAWPIDHEEIPCELPASWEWCRLGALNPNFQNGASSRGDSGGIPVVVLRLADVVDRRISLENTRELAIAPNQIAKYSLQDGDILITRVNGSADIVGRFVRVESDLDAIYCDHFIRMRVVADLADPRFIELLGATALVRDQVASLFITTAGQKTVNQGHISSLLIAVPPLAEQRRIVAKVDKLMALVDQLETQLTASRAIAEKLMEAVVSELERNNDVGQHERVARRTVTQETKVMAA
ncbi:MAG: restriction endonuclease subunit S [Hydrogenophilales bacterium]|nr:restriction endonuclease subunit S [Hydrogenophilales bacterium]